MSKTNSPFDSDGDGNVDMLTVLHSGYGAEAGGLEKKSRIWSHKSKLSSQAFEAGGMRFNDYTITSALWGENGNAVCRIGASVHEMGHYLGLIDLYDKGM